MEKREKLDALFRPRSVAIVGASDKYDQISGRPLKFFVRYGYKGKIFPVNPKHETLCGIRCFARIEDIPEDIDLALIAVPNRNVLPVVTSCVKKKVKSIVIFSSGFAEIGSEGKRFQEKIEEIIVHSDTRAFGPNCMGFVNLHDSVPAFFGGSLENESNLIPGHVGFLSQSGALSNLCFAVAQKMKIGFSYLMTTGNEMDIDISDCLEYLIKDEKTKVIACFIEGLKDGNKFMTMAKKSMEVKKPIVALKIGKSSVGRKASLSHTGKMTGSDEVYAAAFKKAGIVRADSIEETIDSMFLFTRCLLPSGNRIGIVTITGGGAILMVDKCEELGLEVPELTGKMKQQMLEIIPAYGSALNPVDLTGQLINDVNSIKQSAALLLDSEDIDMVVIFLGMLKNFGEQIIEDIVELSRKTRKMVCVVWMDPPNGAIEILQENRIPAFEDPIRCIKAMSVVVRYADYSKKSELSENTAVHLQGHKRVQLHKEDFDRMLELGLSGRQTLTEHETKRILGAYGVPITKERIASSPEEAIRIAGEIGYPVVLKIHSPEILHKTDVGGVELNLQTPEAVLKGYERILTETRKYAPHAMVGEILVQEAICASVETIIGIKRDPVFGPVIIFGMGGIYAEILNDYSVRIAPLSRHEAEAMVQEIKGFKILEGSRNKGRADTNAIIEALLRVSELAMEFKDKIVELDINPFFVFQEGRGGKVGDALMILG
jgi:acetate---CoA ligase (ADP-forming)